MFWCDQSLQTVSFKKRNIRLRNPSAHTFYCGSEERRNSTPVRQWSSTSCCTDGHSLTWHHSRLTTPTSHYVMVILARFSFLLKHLCSVSGCISCVHSVNHLWRGFGAQIGVLQLSIPVLIWALQTCETPFWFEFHRTPKPLSEAGNEHFRLAVKKLILSLRLYKWLDCRSAWRAALWGHSSADRLILTWTQTNDNFSTLRSSPSGPYLAPTVWH